MDFKRSTNNGKGEKLHDLDRENLSKAISGFENSEGGVIVWGIDCSNDIQLGDVAKAKVPLENPKKFSSWLNGVVSGCTVPPHQRTQNEYTIIKGSDMGFAISLIPKSNNAPHQVTGTGRYYIRAGSSFYPAPHGVLAGLFEKKPHPNIYAYFVTPPATIRHNTVSFSIGINLYNEGPGIARDLFLNIAVFSMPGEKCDLNFQPNKDLWEGQFSFGRKLSFFCKEQLRLVPEAEAQPTKIHFDFKPPFNSNLKIKLSCGGQNSLPNRFELDILFEDIDRLYNNLFNKKLRNEPIEDDLQNFANEILKINKGGTK